MVFVRNYYKHTDSTGELTLLECTPVEKDGTPITHTEYCMTKCGIKIFINGESAEKIKAEDWWK